MVHYLKKSFWIAIIIGIIVQNGYALIGPVRVLPSGNVLLIPNDEIKLTTEHIELYHHPLGIWLVEYRAMLKNLRFHEIVRPVGFPSGYDMRIIEGDLYCDQFENFKVMVNDQEITDINSMTKCANYVETTGTEWSVEDGSGIGFLNTWELKFGPEEEKWITVTFSFVIKKAPPIFKSDVQNSWYADMLKWVHQDYEKRDENNMRLPLNIGSFWAFYPDSIMIQTYVADEWFKVINKNDRRYVNQFINKFEYSEPVGFYSPPEITLDTLKVEDLQSMSPTQLILLKDAFLAKYGKVFKNELIQKYFDAQLWYQRNPEFDKWYLTQWDNENIKLIDEFQKGLKSASRQN